MASHKYLYQNISWYSIGLSIISSGVWCSSQMYHYLQNQFVKNYHSPRIWSINSLVHLGFSAFWTIFFFFFLYWETAVIIWIMFFFFLLEQFSKEINFQPSWGEFFILYFFLNNVSIFTFFFISVCYVCFYCIIICSIILSEMNTFFSFSHFLL